ncbi:MAG: ATP-binding protein [bacterium]
MKINKIKLRNYGPIREFYFEPKDFNIIFGMNETGKTALVEAIVAILFKSRTTRYGRPDDISIELDLGKKLIHLPRQKQAQILTRMEIAPLLYVPASEAELYDKNGQAKFWDSLKLMLSQAGKQIPFAILIRKIREGIGYQPKTNDWNSEKKKLIEGERYRLEQLRNFIQEKGAVENKKKELKKFTTEYTSLNEELNLIETCKKYKFYQNLRKKHNEYIDQRNNLDLYQRYTEEDLIQWQELEIKKENLKNQLEEKQQLENEIDNLNKEFDGVLKKLEWCEKYNIKNRIIQWGKSEQEPNYFYPILTFLSGFLFLILSFYLKFSLILPILIFLTSITGFTIVAVKKSKIKIKRLRLDEVLNDARLCLPGVQTIEDLEKTMQMLADSKIKLEVLLTAKKERLQILNTIDSLEQYEKMIGDLRNKTGCATITQLKAKIEEKNKIKHEIRGLAAEISKYLNENDPAKWKRLIDEKEVAPPAKECDISRAEKIEEMIKNRKEHIDKLLQEIKIFEEVQKTRYDVVDEKNVLNEIFEIECRLKNYNLEIEAVSKAEEILNQMSNELDNFIESLVYGEDSLSENFYFVTQKYKRVKVVNQNFFAVDGEGNEYPINSLSSGAKDQLLLCFRFSALKKLFPEGTFLILDDAFIFADWQRRCRLAELLKKFIDAGNQVLYFTSDTHSRDLLAQFGGLITTLS